MNDETHVLPSTAVDAIAQEAREKGWTPYEHANAIALAAIQQAKVTRTASVADWLRIKETLEESNLFLERQVERLKATRGSDSPPLLDAVRTLMSAYIVRYQGRITGRGNFASVRSNAPMYDEMQALNGAMWEAIEARPSTKTAAPAEPAHSVDHINWWADAYEREGGHAVIVQMLRAYAACCSAGAMQAPQQPL